MGTSGQAPPARPTAAPDAHGIYEFGRFRLRPANRQLTDDAGRPVELTAKAFDALTYFVMHPGRLISREELTQILWPRTVVEENNLNQTIWALRKALGDDSRQQHLIATVPGPRAGTSSSREATGDVTAPGVGDATNTGASANAGNATSPLHLGVSRRSAAAALAATAGLGFAIAAIRLPRGLETPGSPNLWTLTDRIPLTSGPGYNFAPALSPDGTAVAYARQLGDDDQGIYVRSVDGGVSPSRLTPERGRYLNPAWSPLKDRMAFLRRLAPYDYELQIRSCLRRACI